MKQGPGIIIQARMGSSRLPEKVLHPFHQGASILELLVQRLDRKLLALDVCIATTTETADDAIRDFCEKQGIECFRGDEQDVLQRLIDCAHTYAVDPVVRVCADNPFLDPALLDRLVQAVSSTADYAGYVFSDGTPAIKTHVGLFGEAVRRDALERAARVSDSAHAHEHVTPFLYENPDLFDCAFIDVPAAVERLRGVRLTVDTPEDFEVAQFVYEKLQSHGEELSAETLFSLVEAHPSLRQKMNRQIQRNRK